MPQIPTYGGAQVRSTALQPVNQSTFDVSSGSRAIGGALDNVAQGMDRAIRLKAETQANTVDTEITAGWLKWDADNRRKYQGQNVGEYETAANDWWDKARQQYGADLDPMVQKAVGPAIARKRTQAMGNVLGHVGAERERYADQQAEAAAQTSIEFGVDSGDVAGARERVRTIVAEKAARKGWSTDLVEADQQRLLGTLHLTQIQKLAERNPRAAALYYSENKGEIPATAQRGVEQLIKAETENKAATMFASKVAMLPLAEQISKAADIDPEVREKALIQIRNNHALVKAAQGEREAAASDEAWQMVGKGKRVPETVLMRMHGKERVQLQNHLIDRSKLAARGASVKTDWDTYLAARQALASADPQVRATVNLRALTTHIAPAQLEQLVDIQTKTRDPKMVPEVSTSQQDISSRAQGLELRGEKAGKFESAATDMFNEHLKLKGKLPTYEERQSILDSLTKEIVTSPGLIWDTKGKAYLAPRDIRNAALSGGAIKRVATPEEARKLEPGTRFIDPQGIERVR